MTTTLLAPVTDPDLLAELVDVVHETLDGLTETVLPPHPVAVDALDGWVDTTVGMATEDGDVVGGLAVRVHRGLAIGLAAAMTGLPADELGDDEAREVMGELTNILGGVAKTLLDEETALTIPTAATSAPDAPALDGAVDVHHVLGSFLAQLRA